MVNLRDYGINPNAGTSIDDDDSGLQNYDGGGDEDSGGSNVRPGRGTEDRTVSRPTSTTQDRELTNKNPSPRPSRPPRSGVGPVDREPVEDQTSPGPTPTSGGGAGSGGSSISSGGSGGQPNAGSDMAGRQAERVRIEEDLPAIPSGGPFRTEDIFAAAEAEGINEQLEGQVEGLQDTVASLRERLLNQRQEVADDLRDTAGGGGIGLGTVAVAAVVVGILGAIAGRDTGMME